MNAQLIHAHIFDPNRPSLFVKPRKSDPAEYYTVVCSESARCELFAQKTCAARNPLGGGCPFGSAHREIGPTRRAKNFYSWLSEHKEKANKIGYLDMPPERMARVADRVWLPYFAMNVALEGEGFEGKFIPANQFTADLIARLCEACPRGGWFDELIRDYQRKTVPLFVAHLSESFPNLLAEAARSSPRTREILATLTKVGRTAKLATVVPNVGTFEGGWRWDGTHMVATERGAFPPFTKFNAAEVRIIPGADATVKITDNAQCGPNTVFMD